MKVLSGFFRILSRAVYIVIIAALLVVSPIIAGYRPVVILSGSMEPNYPVGGITYYKAADFTEIRVGDAITFNIGEGSLATHRVVSKDEENQSFTTKGDNNPSEDNSPVPYGRVAGKTTNLAIPYAGYLTNYAQNNWYVIAIFGVILLIDMLLPSRKKPNKESKRKIAGDTGADPNGSSPDRQAS